MTVPGFTAEVSLYQTSRPYRMAASGAGGAGAHLDLAQFLPLPDGGGPICRPRCGPCLTDPDSPTGCSRFCIRADCEDYTIRCTGCRPPVVCTCTTTRCCDGTCTTSSPVRC